MKILSIFLLSALIALLKSQQVIQEDGDVLEFIAQVERIPDIEGQPRRFLCIGTVLSLSHVMTPRTVYDIAAAPVTNPNQLRVRFHSNELGDGFQATPVEIIRHASANLAILRFARRIDQQFSFSPRRRSELPFDRFCTLYGFDVNSWSENHNKLIAIPAMMRNTCAFPNPNCAFSINNQQMQCDGFLGAPASCDGQTVSGMVIQDNFCNGTHSHALVFRLHEQLAWINQHVGGAGYLKGTAMIVLIGVTLLKFLW